MTPKNDIFAKNVEVELRPTKNYYMDIEHTIINGYCDDLDAMRQVIYKILNTERYEYIIYSWNYGVELMDLFGEPIDYVCSEIKRRLTDALIQDDRIESVDSFDFELTEKHVLSVRFIVHTIYGGVPIEKEVNF